MLGHENACISTRKPHVTKTTSTPSHCICSLGLLPPRNILSQQAYMMARPHSPGHEHLRDTVVPSKKTSHIYIFCRSLASSPSVRWASVRCHSGVNALQRSGDNDEKLFRVFFCWLAPKLGRGNTDPDRPKERAVLV